MERSARSNYSTAFKYLLTVVGMTVFMTACGGGSSKSTNTTVTISISPTAVTLSAGATQQFTATVSNTSNTAVTWQVNGVTGGNSTLGTITTAGLYTAPTALPSASITVSAVSQADSSVTATAAVTVTISSSLAINPKSVTLPAGGQQTFTASLGGTSTSATFSVSCQSSAVGACGTVTQAGVYTAPLSPPPGGAVTVTASSPNGTANPASAGVTITFGTGTLQGSYSFSMTGRSAGQPFSEVGSIAFDGKGAITGGSEDQLSGSTITITGGAYTLGTDGRVTATVHTSAGDEIWQLSTVNHNHLLAMRADAVVARGDLDLQDATQFGKFFNGNLTFSFSGEVPAGASPFAAGVGAMVGDGAGAITSGTLDVNNAGAPSTALALTGSCTASAANTGRGTLTLASAFGTQTFVYYTFSATDAKLIETDGLHAFAGRVEQRPQGPISLGLYAGSYAFVFSGANAQGSVGQGGTFTVDSNGSVTNGVLDVGSDTTFALGFLFSGNFVESDPATGRTVATLNVAGNPLQFVFYATSSRNLTFLEIDTRNATVGQALPQNTTFVNNGVAPSFTGQFAFNAGESNATIARTISGSAALTSSPTGTLDLNDVGSVTLGAPLTGSSFAVTSLAGRGSLTAQAGSYHAGFSAYIVDANRVLLLQTDGHAALTGSLQKQF